MAAAEPPSGKGLKWVDTTLRRWKETKEAVTDLNAIKSDLNAINIIIKSALTAKDNIFVSNKLLELSQLCEKQPPSLNDVAAKAAEVFSLVHPILEQEMKADRKEWGVEEFEGSQRTMGAGAAAAAATADGAAASAAEAGASSVQSQIGKNEVLRNKQIAFGFALAKFDRSNKSEADFNELMQAGWQVMRVAYRVAKSRISSIKEDEKRTQIDAQRVVQDFGNVVQAVWKNIEDRKPKTLTSRAERSLFIKGLNLFKFLQGITESVSDAKIYTNETAFNKTWRAFRTFVNTQIESK